MLITCAAGSYNLLPKAISDLRSQQQPSAREREQAVQSMNQLIRSKLVQVGSTAQTSFVFQVEAALQTWSFCQSVTAGS